jgi:hypothetical protein
VKDISSFQANISGLEGSGIALGGGALARIGQRDPVSGAPSLPVHRRDPNTDWPDGSGVAIDQKGFVLTGSGPDQTRRPWETSARGVFTIGDVRSGSIKRVAAALGADITPRWMRFIMSGRGKT